MTLATATSFSCGCKLDRTPSRSSRDIGTGLAASGGPLADGDTEQPDSIVHLTRGHIDLTISTTGPPLPDAAV